MDFLDQEIDLDSEWSNKRTAVRYLRNDIKAAVKVHSLWFPRLFPVLLRDISSRGAAIVTSHKIKKKKPGQPISIVRRRQAVSGRSRRGPPRCRQPTLRRQIRQPE